MTTQTLVRTLKSQIRQVPDFPKPGILFYDITTLLRNPDGVKAVIEAMSSPFLGTRIDLVAAVESRGFILGGAVAERLGAGFVPVRKPGKLPAKAVRVTYQLEYGEDCVEVHEDAIAEGQRVLVVDDVLATGGTAQATVQLVKQLRGEVVGVSFLIELAFLHGRDRLVGEQIHTVLSYDA